MIADKICPVCGIYNFSSETSPGTYDICCFCLWENDPVQFANPDYDDGTNNISLNQAKLNFKKYGVINPAK
jgi:hypothetical protein